MARNYSHKDDKETFEREEKQRLFFERHPELKGFINALISGRVHSYYEYMELLERRKQKSELNNKEVTNVSIPGDNIQVVQSTPALETKIPKVREEPEEVYLSPELIEKVGALFDEALKNNALTNARKREILYSIKMTEAQRDEFWYRLLLLEEEGLLVDVGPDNKVL